MRARVSVLMYEHVPQNFKTVCVKLLMCWVVGVLILSPYYEKVHICFGGKSLVLFQSLIIRYIWEYADSKLTNSLETSIVLLFITWETAHVIKSWTGWSMRSNFDCQWTKPHHQIYLGVCRQQINQLPRNIYSFVIHYMRNSSNAIKWGTTNNPNCKSCTCRWWLFITRTG